MNESLNPHAIPFRPGGSDRRFPPMPPGFPPPFMPPPHMMQGGPWPNFPPPPPPFFTGNHNEYNNHAPPPHPRQLQHPHPHPHPYQHEQAPPPPNFGAWPPRPHDFHQQPPPYGMPHNNGMSHDNGQHYQRGPQQFPPPGFPPFHQQGPPPFPHPAHFGAMNQARMPQGATPEDIQYAFTALIERKRARRHATNATNRMPAPPAKKSKKAKAKAKAQAQAQAEADGLDMQEYDFPEQAIPPRKFIARIDKAYSNNRTTATPKKGRYGHDKIMLPAPAPLDAYLAQASEEPAVAVAPQSLLVILDLNGTVLYRPNKNPQTMIARPYLAPFLRYLFQNFKVMVWSSAKPANVKALVDQALSKDLRSKLVASWARDTFGLSATNYNQNVQVYKNLRLIWSRDQIQQHHPKYDAGERFGQHNTVLIDDSALKANAQPYNLLEIPEFEATPDQMEGDVLCEIAGYLEVLRHQADVSRFAKREPFSGGRWKYDWPAEPASSGDTKSKPPSKATLGVPQSQGP